MDNIHCDGNETEIKHCRFDGWGKNDCEASEAAGVVCKGFEVDSTKTKSQSTNKVTKHLLSKKYDIELRLSGGRNKYEGQVEVSTTIVASRVLVRSLVCCCAPSSLSRFLSLFVSTCRPLTLYENASDGNAAHLCLIITMCVEWVVSNIFIRFIYSLFHQIRFNKVMKKGHWGGICGDGWSLLEANVVCKSLNLGYASNAMQTDIFSKNTLSKLLISGTECHGNESSIQDCMHHELGNVVCPGDQSKVAAVICTEKIADLVFDHVELTQSAHLEDRPMLLLQCAMEENCLATRAYEIQRDQNDWHMETRRLLKFTARTLNAGTADFRPNIPKHLWEWHLCHQ